MVQSVAEKSAQLRALVRLLADASEVVIKEWENEAKQAPLEEPTAIPSPKLFEARRVVLGACGMCIDLVQDPLLKLTEAVCSYFAAKALNVVVKARVADVLADADPLQGVHIDVISRKTGINGRKLLPLLRCLSAIHIFAEVTDHYFINTNTSEHLVNNEGLRSWLLLSIEGSAAAQELPTVLFDPVRTHSTSTREAAFQEAYGTNQTLWEYLEQPVQQADGTLAPRPALGRWIAGMVTGGQVEGTALYIDYPWTKLGSSTIVDVGGGIGGMSLELAQRFPDLQFIVQDREAVVQKAEAVWLQELPSALQAERVKFMPHDFFAEQPVKGADVFILRHILHDWPDEECVTILSHIRQAMRPDSLLLIADKVIQTTAGSSLLKRAPLPLPPNYGYAEHVVTVMAMVMLTMFNGAERTAEELRSLASKAGLKVAKVWECRGLTFVTELRRDD